MTRQDSLSTLRWQLDQVYNKATPKAFMRSVSNVQHPSLKGGDKRRPMSPWVLDILLYVILVSVVVAFVYIVSSFAKDFKPS